MSNRSPIHDSRTITTLDQLEALLKTDPNDPRVVALMNEVRERSQSAQVSGKSALSQILSERRALARRLSKQPKRRISDSTVSWGMAIGILAGNAYVWCALGEQPDRKVTWVILIMLNTAFCIAPSAGRWFAHKATESGISSIARGSLAILIAGMIVGSIAFGGIVWALSTVSYLETMWRLLWPF